MYYIIIANFKHKNKSKLLYLFILFDIFRFYRINKSSKTLYKYK